MTNIGRKAKIKSNNDNENYDQWRRKVLIVTREDFEGPGFDPNGGSPLYSFDCADGSKFPFSLYKWEFNFLK